MDILTFDRLLEDIKHIPEVARGLVSIDITEREDGVAVDAIWSEVERGKGHAGRALKAFLDLADDHQADVYGHPHWLAYDLEARAEQGYSPEDVGRMDELNAQRLDNDALLAWYQRMGFEVTGRRQGDDLEIVRRCRDPVPAPVI